MEREKTFRLSDPVYLTGIILVLISMTVYMLSGNEFISVSNNHLGVFFINYGISALYFVIMFVNGFIGFRRPFFKTSINYFIPLVILLIISAFVLNRQVCLFEKMVDWVSIILVVQCIILLAFPFIEHFPRFLKGIISFCTAFSLLPTIYFAIYLMPYYGLGIIGSFLIGITLHVFVPLILLTVCLVLLFRTMKKFPGLLYSALAGFIIPFIILIVFVARWTSRTNEINYLMNNTIMNESEIPNWIRISQHVTDDLTLEKILKTDLMYTVPSNHFEPFRTDLPSLNFENARQHDPLIFVACLFSTQPDLTNEEKLNILKSRYDVRHQAQERLWRGENLKTANVISNIRIFPQNRLAYTEKIISIKNSESENRFRNQEEAIYTFHLPEGSVVTSLSLWIDGEEQKGILTSKSKADTAYKTIVGKERRDPSVIHWQEGNTVTARIFPCTPDENRRFKIGVTSPLKMINNQLVYENIYFDGPPAIHTTESAQVQFDSPVTNLKMPAGFSGTNLRITKQKSYTAYWEIAFDATQLSTDPFTFDGKNYQASEYVKKFESFNPAEIYLDINSSWDENEFNEIWKLLKDKKVYCVNDEPILLTESNHTEIFSEQKKLAFSLFPFYKIPNENCLVITSSNALSPQLDDLENSKFGNKLKKYFAEPKNIRVFNLGDELSPYLKSLKEIRAFIYEGGNYNDLQKLFNKKEFIKSQEDNNTVILDNSSMMIKEDSTAVNGKGSDHLMRLFAYNHVLKQIGSDFFTPEKIGENIIAEAAKAYVVSPVSSLIVLETKADYDRFGIEQTKNSLNNASIKGEGSVPEPHEIFLIVFVILIVIAVYFNPLKA